MRPVSAIDRYAEAARQPRIYQPAFGECDNKAPDQSVKSLKVLGCKLGYAEQPNRRGAMDAFFELVGGFDTASPLLRIIAGALILLAPLSAFYLSTRKREQSLSLQ